MPNSKAATRSEIARPVPPVLRPASRLSRRRIFTTLVILALSALVFLAFVVQQRDVRAREIAVQRLEPVRKWLADYVEERGYLPPEVPEDLALLPEHPALPYPAKEEINRIRRHEGPFALVIGQSVGLITPGTDGCAAVVYDHGQVRVEWLTLAEIRAEREKRLDMLQAN